MQATGIFNTIALYALDLEKVDVRAWYESALQWFAKYGKQPTRMEITGESYSPRKTTTFKHGNKKLYELNFQSIENIGVYANIPNHEYDSDDVFLSTSLDVNHERPRLIFSMQDAVIPYDPNYCEGLIKELFAYVPFKYGIVYRRDNDWGPLWYAYGAVMTPFNTTKEEENEVYRVDTIGGWLKYYGAPSHWSMRYEPYHLRNVYPLNFLSSAPLNYDVGNGYNLRTFIQSSPEHGELVPLNERLTSWRVPEGNIDAIREKLRPSGILLCARPLTEQEQPSPNALETLRKAFPTGK